VDLDFCPQREHEGFHQRGNLGGFFHVDDDVRAPRTTSEASRLRTRPAGCLGLAAQHLGGGIGRELLPDKISEGVPQQYVEAVQGARCVATSPKANVPRFDPVRHAESATAKAAEVIIAKTPVA
jgi:hypothetical protein